MKISVVTASYNQGSFIEEAIESVHTQNSGAFEHIIQDNCSTDSTQEILKKHSHLRVITGPDKGQSDALNKGFKAVSGDIIGWLNADDKYLPGCFRAVVDFFENNPQCDIVYGDYRVIDKDGKVLKLRKEIPFDLFMLKYLHVLCIPSTASFFRKKIFDDGNFLDTRYQFAMDYEFFLRLALKGYQFRHIPVFLADFRTHGESKSFRHEILQRQEREQALLEQDKFWQSFQSPCKPFIRGGLLIAARLKRSLLKLIGGKFF